MASGGFPFPNRHRADSALLIYLNAMQGYVASILERAHGQDWARSQLLTEKLKKRDWAEYERRRLALDAGKEAQHLIEFPVLSQLIDDNRKSFAAWRNDDFNRVESIRDLRNELSHPDSPRECSPDLTSAIVMNCTRALRRCGLHDAVKDIEQLPPATTVTADATPDIDQRDRKLWLADLPAGSIPAGLTPAEHEIHVEGLWGEEKKQRSWESDEIAGFDNDIDGLRKWFDAEPKRSSRHEPEHAELLQREEQRLERERSEIAELHQRLREWFDAEEGRPQRHEVEYSALVQRQLAQYEQQRPEQEQGQLDQLENNLPAQPQRPADDLEQEPTKFAESGQAAGAEQTTPVHTAFERSSLREDRSSPVVRARLGSGGRHSVALRENGRVVCWGGNAVGQLKAPGGRFVAVSAGRSHNVALRKTGTMVCWGDNSSGQCDAPKGEFVTVSAGSSHTIALRREDGTVICWGDNSSGQCDAPKGKFVAVSAGSRHSAALREDGTVICWGDNSDGQCDAPEGRFVAVSAGSRHSAALREDGTVICWGDNSSGQCDAPKGRFIAVSAGGAHSVALRKNSTMVCWGNNASGQRNAPKGRFIAVSAGRSHNIALREDGTVVCWGHNSHGQLNAPSERL